MKRADTAYELNRSFPVPAEKLFNAFTDEDVLKKIWGVSSISIDARPGGTANAELEFNGDNRNFIISYLEVQPFEKLKWIVHFERFPAKETRVTLLFKEIDGGTDFTVRQENFETPQERDENRKAWEYALNTLEGVLD